MKAEHHEIDLGQDLALGGRILAPLRVDAADRDAGNVLQALADAEAGRARLAVDEDGLGLEAEILRSSESWCVMVDPFSPVGRLI